MFRKGLAVVALLAIGLAGCSKPATPAAGPSPDASPEFTAPATAAVGADLGRTLSTAHAATAKYANDLAAAEKDGYMIITGMMPGMGYHYLNPNIQGFNPTQPDILVYNRSGNSDHLVALEWVFTEKPKIAPLAGATYGSFDAACHYKDGTFTPAAAEKDCAKTSPQGGSPFNFWHPNLVTLHVWLWYDNPAGLYNSTNPLVGPFTN
jgi:hypothetical protein